ncbi:MAG: reverse transcriptase domain-containing protein [Desulfobacterium sp.]|nr:reverse transcriptase domain-containing protein [Desulfobacterium sp.]
MGIPTVADRTAQMAAKMIIEPRLEQIFHPSSYGYRPGRGAKDAVEQVRRNCWRYDWVLDMDIKAFFNGIYIREWQSNAMTWDQGYQKYT